MKQAITTRYLGPTNSKGSRVVATTASGLRCVIPYHHCLHSDYMAHRHAVLALCERVGWSQDMGSLIGGTLRNGYVFVFPSE